MITTPHGLRVPISEAEAQAIDRMSGKLDVGDALLNVELWASLPNGAASIAAIIVSLATESIGWTMASSVGAFLFFRVVTQFYYSAFVSVAIAQLLGAWFIALPCSLGAAWVLRRHDATALGILQFALVLVGGHWGALEVAALPLLPVLGPSKAERLALFSSLRRQARERGIPFELPGVSEVGGATPA